MADGVRFVDSPLFIVLIAVIVVAALVVVVVIRRKAFGSSGPKEISLSETPGGMPTAAYILEMNQTSMHVDNMPQIMLKVALFPANGPMEVVECKQIFSFADLPNIVPGALVYVSYHRDVRGAVRDIKVLGPRQVEWEGDAEVKKAVDSLMERMRNCKLLQGQGMILAADETGAKLCGLPVYHYHIRYRTEDGKTIEGDTWQAARPWLAERRRTDPSVVVQYSAVDNNDFSMARQ